MKRLLVVLLLAVLCSISSRPLTASGRSLHAWPRAKGYAHALVIKRWHTAAEWRAEDAIVTAESGWDVCAVYSMQHLCSYSWPRGAGGNACGIGQRYYCPPRWRGRLGAAWRDQVRDLQDYISRRYGDPIAAKAFRDANGWY